MRLQRSVLPIGLVAVTVLCGAMHGEVGLAADIIVSAQDGKFVRVEGRATFPQPAPPDSLVVIDASASSSTPARAFRSRRIPCRYGRCRDDQTMPAVRFSRAIT
jgi:hypothetical protein